MKPDLKSPPVIVIGGANMDLTGQAAVDVRAGDSLPGVVRASAGGVGRNIAEALARMGRHTRLITALGDDGFAEDIVRQTSVAGVDLRATLRVPERTTSTYLSVLDRDGEMQLAINDMALVNELTPSVIEARHRDLDEGCAWVVDANLSEETLEALFAHAGSRPVCAEPVSASKALKLRPHLAQIRLLKPNRMEAAALTGLDEDCPAQALADALHTQGVGRVVISLGREGTFASDQDTGVTAHVPAFAGPIVSVTGAGDTLMAALVDTFVDGLPLEPSLAWAQAAASLSLRSERAIHPALCQAAIRAELEAQS